MPHVLPPCHSPAGSGKTALVRHLAASMGRRLAAVSCCQELQPEALTRAVRAAAASGSWLLLEGVEQLPPAALELLAGHLAALREAASEGGAEEVLTLQGAWGRLQAHLPACLPACLTACLPAVRVMPDAASCRYCLNATARWPRARRSWFVPQGQRCASSLMSPACRSPQLPTSLHPCRARADVTTPLRPSFRLLATSREAAPPQQLQPHLAAAALQPAHPAAVLAASLQSLGCAGGKQLSAKLQQLFALALQRLPSLAACHLAHCLAGAGPPAAGQKAAGDLRPVAGLLAAARHQRGGAPPASEEQLVAAAVRQAVLPALSQQDAPAFEGMLAQALPAAAAASEEAIDAAFLPAQQERDVSAALMHGALLGAFPRLGLQPSGPLLAKAQQLQQALESGPSALLLGPACSGKSSAALLLASAAQEMAANGASGALATAVLVSELHPGAWDVGQLLGRGGADGGWQDGWLAAAVRAAAEEAGQAECQGGRQQTRQHWVVLRGGVQGGWLRHMQPLLAPQGPHLQLPSGEVLPAPPNLRLLLELTEAGQQPGAPAGNGGERVAEEPACQPAACGAAAAIFFHEPGLVAWPALLRSWALHLPDELLLAAEDRQRLSELCGLLLPRCLAAAAAASAASQGGAAVPEAQLARRALQLLEALLRGGGAAPAALLQHPRWAGALQPLLAAGRPFVERQALLQAAVVAALAWGLGGHMPGAARLLLDAELRGALAAAAEGQLPAPDSGPAEHGGAAPLRLLVPLPEGRPVFDLAFDPAALRWVPWSDLPQAQQQQEGGGGGGAAEGGEAPLALTLEQLRCAWLVCLLQHAGVPVALLGPAGAGKSALLRHLLRGQQQQQQQQQAPGGACVPGVVCYSHGGCMGGSKGLASMVAAGHAAQALQQGSGQLQGLDLLVDGLVEGGQVRQGG
jgi:hypothetical protein